MTVRTGLRAIALLFTALSLTLGLVTIPAQGQTEAALLTPLAGLTQWLPQGGTAWRTLQAAQLVNATDQVRTGASGYARLTTPAGITLDILPSTQMYLNQAILSASGGAGNSSNQYGSSQYVGVSYSKIKPTTSRADKVQFYSPTGGIFVTGTAFVQYTSGDGVQAIIGQEGKVRYTTAALLPFTIGANQMLISYLPGGYPAEVTLATLGQAQVTLVQAPMNLVRLDALQVFMRSLLKQYENPAVFTLLSGLLGLPADSVSAEILTAINGLTPNQVDLRRYIPAFVQFFSVDYGVALGTALAPLTCGNGMVDPGETIDNCIDDLSYLLEPSQCGNGICQQNEGDSLISCQQDCFPNPAAALTGAGLIEQSQQFTPTPTARAGRPRVTFTPGGNVQPVPTTPAPRQPGTTPTGIVLPLVSPVPGKPTGTTYVPSKTPTAIATSPFILIGPIYILPSRTPTPYVIN